MPEANHRGTAALFLVLVATACSSPTAPEVPEGAWILENLLDFPEVNQPPLTAENAANPFYQIVTGQIQNLIDLRARYVRWADSLLTTGVEPVKTGNQFVWHYQMASGQDTFQLQVSVRDTLVFSMDWYGESYVLPGGPVHAAGWLIPFTANAEISPSVYYWLRWTEETEFTRVSAYWNTLRYTLEDSLNGGGRLIMSRPPLGAEYLYSSWDPIGHGFLVSADLGSGDW